MVTKTNRWQPHEEALTEDLQVQSGFRNRPPEIVNDRFRIVRELGRGGMATVYLAEDLTEGKQVAIKMMSSALSGSAKQRFTREFSTIASLRHPYLVEVFEYGESQSGPFFVMELFSGEPATKMIGAAAPHVYDALYKLCEAVEFVHSKRIIHRDIKPANIMVQAKAGGNGFDIRLSDFGLAKFANSSSSITGDVNFLGTLAYCAPEQIMREELDYRADLYSLGMVVYEVLTGHHPFEACRNDAQALISAQLTRYPAHIREFNKQLSVDLERVIHQMLAKEPEERPQSTLELRHALANELGWSDGKVSNAFAGAPRNMAAPFVGRESELKSLEGFITRCWRGYSDSDSMLPAKKEPATILFVAGEAGIGKTSLIKRAARSALIGGAKIYDGRCFDGNLAPFQPFAEILKQILSERERVRRKAQKGPQDDSLASTTFVQVAGSTLATQAIDSVIEEYAVDLLRCGADLKSLLDGDLKADRAEIPRDSEYVFRSLAGFFVELSKHQSMLLLIDDIHWADRSSVILLRHIASSATIARHDAQIRGGPSPRLAIIGSTRNTNEYGKTLRFINELCESDLADKLTLTPLSEEGVRQLVSNQIGARYDEVAEGLSSRIAMECLGNPFYICQTIREWKLNGRIKFDGLLWGLSSEQFADGETLPDSVREALRSRLRKLPEVTAKTLGIAAVTGANVDVDLLQLLAGQGNEFDFFDTLDDLLGREILRETGRPKVLAFAHDLLREACLSNLSATRRQGIHQMIGEALERQRESGKNVTDSLLAEHFLAAHCDKKAFEYLVRAGCSATATYAHADAVSLLEKAKQLDAPSFAKSVRYRLYEHLGASYAAIGRFENSIDEFESALEVAQSQFELAKIHFGIGKAHTWIGRNDKGRESYESALKLIGHPQPKSKLGYAWGAIWSGIQFQFAPRWHVSFWPKNTDTSAETLASEIYFANCFLLFQIHILAYVYGSIQLALLAKHSNDSDAIALAYSKYGGDMGWQTHCLAKVTLIER